MSQGESIITILLAVIAYFLYQIARQLTFLTGKRMKISLFNKTLYRGSNFPATKVSKKEKKEEKLPN